MLVRDGGVWSNLLLLEAYPLFHFTHPLCPIFYTSLLTDLNSFYTTSDMTSRKTSVREYHVLLLPISRRLANWVHACHRMTLCPSSSGSLQYFLLFLMCFSDSLLFPLLLWLGMFMDGLFNSSSWAVKHSRSCNTVKLRRYTGFYLISSFILFLLPLYQRWKCKIRLQLCHNLFIYPISSSFIIYVSVHLPGTL